MFQAACLVWWKKVKKRDSQDSQPALGTSPQGSGSSGEGGAGRQGHRWGGPGTGSSPDWTSRTAVGGFLEAGGSFDMGLSEEELRQELEATAQEVLGRLQSRRLFQSEWDTAAFVIFLVFVGTVLFLLLLVLVHCCCCCCCATPRPHKERPKGVDNLAMEP